MIEGFVVVMFVAIIVVVMVNDIWDDRNED